MLLASFRKNIFAGKTLYGFGYSSAPRSHKGVIPKVRVLFAVLRGCQWKPGIHSQVDELPSTERNDLCE
jgi:hypothetical protein